MARTYNFDLDRFQTEAIAALDAGTSVLVAAPTGSGKTVVAEHAIADAIEHGEKAFYTTPIKALSNQKYRDLVADYGPSNVGLLTGDTAIAAHAPIVVMTTEVLRNMIYAQSDRLHGLRYVILDEVHYLQDSWRGPVWEEVIVHLPLDVRLVCLSATVSNTDELAGWIQSVRGQVTSVVATKRPVELEHLYMIGERNNRRDHLIHTSVKGRPNHQGYDFDLDRRGGSRGGNSGGGPRHQRGDRGKRRRPYVTPRRLDVVERLQQEKLLPAIYFIFSRAGCDDALDRCVESGLSFTDDAAKAAIDKIIADRIGGLRAEDLAVLEWPRLRTGLRRGVAAHHAGMVPIFKEIVETCFIDGLIKVVFATETLALGINMPARSVVIEKLSKYNGETHEILTPAQYTQLTGRAGRRGIDEEGTAVVLWNSFVSFDEVARLARSKSYALRSAFRPSYNMAANLVRRYEPDDAYRLLGQSFAQYQTNVSLGRLEHRLEEHVEAAERYREQLGQDLDVVRAERDARAAAADDRSSDLLDPSKAVSALSPGDIVVGLPDTDRAAVLSVAFRKRGVVRLRVIDSDGDVLTYEAADLVEAPSKVGQIELPRPFSPNNRAFQSEVTRLLVRARTGPRAKRAKKRRDETRPLGDELDRLVLLERFEQAERDVRDTERRIARKANSIADQFRAVLGILTEWGHVVSEPAGSHRPWDLTEAGERTVRIYHELDLLIAESLGRGHFDGLDVSSLAGLASLFVYEHRSKEPPPDPWFPSKLVSDRADDIDRMARELNRLERRGGLQLSRLPDPSLFAIAHAWAAGQDLDEILDEMLTGGDFVRTLKQLVDLLRQIGDVAPDPATARTARAAAEAVSRGVVTSSSDPDPGAATQHAAAPQDDGEPRVGE